MSLATQRRRQCTRDVRHVMQEPHRDTPERRDWTKLLPDLVAEIAGRLLGVDLTEYIRFRAVCKPWRQLTDDPRGLNSRFFPRNWVMLSNYGEGTRRRLLNVATGASIVDLDLPELAGHHPLGYAEGLLVLWNTTTYAIRLFNSLTRAVTDLPDFSSIIYDLTNASGVAMDMYGFGGFGVIDGAASPPTVVVFLHGKVPVLACIRLGEPHWALVDTSELSAGGAGKMSSLSALSLHGRFYLSTSMGDVLTLELHPAPRLVYVIRQTTTVAAATLPPVRCSFFLAPSSDDDGRRMLMVRFSQDDDHTEVAVFDVDVDGRRLVPTSTVGAGRALFVGSLRTLSVSTTLFPSIAASDNAVYFCHGHGPGDKLFSVFYIDSGRDETALELEFFDQMDGPFFGPFNLDVYLAYCVDLVLGAMI
ncbi:hypothetical protein BS78_04G206600 [Paspalum vaginatum]|nr:hypothetical protein BS78_04G206600 [Paspalum vaginatum]